MACARKRAHRHRRGLHAANEGEDFDDPDARPPRKLDNRSRRPARTCRITLTRTGDDTRPATCTEPKTRTRTGLTLELSGGCRRRVIVLQPTLSRPLERMVRHHHNVWRRSDVRKHHCARLLPEDHSPSSCPNLLECADQSAQNLEIWLRQLWVECNAPNEQSHNGIQEAD